MKALASLASSAPLGHRLPSCSQSLRSASSTWPYQNASCASAGLRSGRSTVPSSSDCSLVKKSGARLKTVRSKPGVWSTLTLAATSLDRPSKTVTASSSGWPRAQRLMTRG